MKLTKRSSIIVALGGIAATAAVAVPSGSAQAPGPTVLSFYEPDAQSIFKIVDAPPKSPVSNPQSPRFRFSIGDKLTFASSLFDKKGGTRLGKLYAEGTLVKGGSFRTAAIIADGTYVLTDRSQIAVQGYLSFSSDSTFSVVGGSGRYEGARGHVSSTSNDTSSTDTVTLLP